jgi:hypothetical protein
MGHREHPNVHMLPLKYSKNTGVPSVEHRDPEAVLFFIMTEIYRMLRGETAQTDH